MKIAKEAALPGGLSLTKSLAEFAARRRQSRSIIFHRDMCVGENTSQARSSGICSPQANKLCAQQTVNLLLKKQSFFNNSRPPFRAALFLSSRVIVSLYKGQKQLLRSAGGHTLSVRQVDSPLQPRLVHREYQHPALLLLLHHG